MSGSYPPASTLRMAALALAVPVSGCASTLQESPPATALAPTGALAPLPAQPAAAPLSAPAPDYCSPQFQAQFGWPDPEKAARVCRCESRGNPNASSPGGRYRGLFQFSDASWRTEGGGDIFDPYTNSHHAHRLFLRRGWKPWPHCGRD